MEFVGGFTDGKEGGTPSVRSGHDGVLNEFQRVSSTSFFGPYPGPKRRQ